MITKKLLRRQTYWAEFLSTFIFLISYISSRENRKTNILTYRLNDCLANDHDD